MAHPHEDLLRSAYAAFSQRDIEALVGLLSDDIIVHSPGRNPLSGDYKGVQAVRDWLGQLVQRSGGTFRVEVHDVLAGDEHAIGLVWVTGQREGRELNMPVVHVLHVRDGKLAELWIHPADQYAIDEFWA